MVRNSLVMGSNVMYRASWRLEKQLQSRRCVENERKRASIRRQCNAEEKQPGLLEERRKREKKEYRRCVAHGIRVWRKEKLTSCGAVVEYINSFSGLTVAVYYDQFQARRYNCQLAAALQIYRCEDLVQNTAGPTFQSLGSTRLYVVKIHISPRLRKYSQICGKDWPASASKGSWGD